MHAYLAKSPARACFLTQIESSPYAVRFRASQDETADPFIEAALRSDMAPLLLPLPLEVLFDLVLAPAIRLVSAGLDLDEAALRTVAQACWRAITAREQTTPGDPEGDPGQ